MAHVAASKDLAPANANPSSESFSGTWRVVKPGDNLSKIAEEAYGRGQGKRYTDILNANPGLTDKINPGQKIFVPALSPSNQEAVQDGLTRYEVTAGDTVSKIAKKFYGNGSPENCGQIAAANKLSDPGKIKVGQVLIIPALNSQPVQKQVCEVQQGDTLFSVSLRAFKDSSLGENLIRANPEIDPFKLEPGKKLIVIKDCPPGSPEVEAKVEAFLNRYVVPLTSRDSAPGHVKSFIKAHEGLALHIERNYGIPAELALAQAALETGWGEKPIGGNLFGIKARKGDPNAVASVTTEYRNGVRQVAVERFQAHDSTYDSFKAWAELLVKRYGETVVNAHDLDACIAAVARKGYATDPNYASKLRNVCRYMRREAMASARSVEKVSGS